MTRAFSAAALRCRRRARARRVLYFSTRQRRSRFRKKIGGRRREVASLAAGLRSSHERHFHERSRSATPTRMGASPPFIYRRRRRLKQAYHATTTPIF